MPARAPVTRLFIARHGATRLSAHGRFAGAVAVGLSEEGRQQAARLAERLRHAGLAAVYTSPVSRALETARAVAEACGVPLAAHDGLREVDHGRWEGLTRDEAAARYPEEYAAWRADPFARAARGGESGADVLRRALPAVREIVARHPGERVLVVSHRAAIRLVLGALLGLDPRRYREQLDQAPASVNVVDFRGPDHPRLVLFNDTSHYEPLPPDPGVFPPD